MADAVTDLLAYCREHVPPQIAALRARGGPASWEYGQALQALRLLLAYAEPGRCEADLLARVVDAIALLAWAPGGVTVGGVHFQVEGETHAG
jgi:hypothetical protein